MDFVALVRADGLGLGRIDFGEAFRHPSVEMGQASNQGAGVILDVSTVVSPPSTGEEMNNTVALRSEGSAAVKAAREVDKGEKIGERKGR